MSRPWKSVPSGAVTLPPPIQNGGSNTFAPCTGSVGSYGAIRSAKSATSDEAAEDDDGDQRRIAHHLDDRPERAAAAAREGRVAGMVAIVPYLASRMRGSMKA